MVKRERRKVGGDRETECDSGLVFISPQRNLGGNLGQEKYPKKHCREYPSSSGRHMLDLGQGSARTKEGIKVTLEITTWVAASPESGLSESFMRNIKALHINRKLDIRCLRRRQGEFNCSEPV